MELWWKRRFLYPNKWATNALMHCRRVGSFWSQSQVYAHQLVKREISQCLSRLVHLRRSFRFRGSRRLSVTKRIVNFYRYNQVHRFWWVQIGWRDQKLFRTQPHVLSVKLDSIWLRKVRWRCNYQRKHTYSRIIRQLVESKEIWSEPNDAFALGSGRRHWWSNWARRLKRLPTRRCRCIAKLYRKGLGLGIQDNFEPELNCDWTKRLHASWSFIRRGRPPRHINIRDFSHPQHLQSQPFGQFLGLQALYIRRERRPSEDFIDWQYQRVLLG